MRPPGGVQGAVQGARDAGFTLVELLVAMVLTSILGSTLMSVMLSLQKATTDAQSNSHLLQESRVATERLVRELRQAVTIDKVTLPPTPASASAITFWADFDNDAVRDLDAVDPEVLTYRFNPTTRRLTLTVNDAAGTAVTRPILATSVTGFGLDLRSSLWKYDRDGDGVVDWADLDAASGIGNNNGVPDGSELLHVDSIVVTITLQDGPRNQAYRTQVNFRNRNLS